MTAKRDLKKRVRQRQERTGESYTTARAHVLAARPADAPEPGGTPVDVVELIALDAEAERLGLRCRVSMSATLRERVEAGAVLERLRAALLATLADASTALLRGVLLRGEPAPLAPRLVLPSSLEGARRFLTRARAGIAGVSESGRMLALHVDGRARAETLVFVLGPQPPLLREPRPPTLLVWLPEDLLEAHDHALWFGL